MEGLRFNEGKTRHVLVPPFAQEQYAKVLTKGSEKYAERNWELGMKWSKVLDSLKRHILAIERGEDYDPEDGLLHSAHAMCNAAFLTEYYKIYPQGDDRPHIYLKAPKIGLDIDDVICDFIPAFKDKFNLPDASSWSWSYRMHEAFQYLDDHRKEAEEFYLNIPRKINPEDIPFEPHCYITSRSIPTEDMTKKWIEKNGFPCSPVYTVPHGASKIQVAKDSGIDIFVDDKFDNFVELNNAGICCYLFDAPHNQRYNVGFKRIKSLGEIFNKV